MISVHLQIVSVLVEVGPPRLFFVRAQLAQPLGLAAPHAASSSKSHPIQQPPGLSLRTDVSLEPSLAPTFRLPKLHFRLPHTPGAGSSKNAGAGTGTGGLFSNRASTKPTAAAAAATSTTAAAAAQRALELAVDPVVSLELYELPDPEQQQPINGTDDGSVIGPRLLGRAEARIRALVDTAPPLLLSAVGGVGGSVGAIKVTARVFDGKSVLATATTKNDALPTTEATGSTTAASSSTWKSAAQAAAAAVPSSDNDWENVTDLGVSGKRLVVTILGIRNAQAFRGQPVFFALTQGTAVRARSPAFGIPKTSDTHFPTVTLAALIDPVFNTTSLATLLLHPGDPSRVTLTPLAPTSVKFHLSVGTAAFPSFVQQHVTLRSGVLQLTALVTAMDLAHPPALVPSAIACRVLGTSAAIPGHESGHPVLAVQCIDSTDAFLSSMMALGMDRRKPSMPAFPEAEFAGAGHPVAGWPPPTMAHASSKYLVASNSAANRGLGAGNPARWDMAVVLPGTAHSTTGASALAFLVYVLAGGPTAAAAGGGGDAHEYALVAYGVLPFADAPAVPSPMAETVSHVRMYAMPGVRGKSRGNKVTLGVQVRQGPNVAGGAGRRPLAIEDALVTMPVLEPPRQDALMDEFQDIARSIMALRVEKRRLEHDHARLEKLVAGHVDPISPPPANIHSMPREELLGLCAQMQATVTELQAKHAAALGIATKHAAAHQEVGGTTAQPERIQELQELLAKQHLEIQQLQVHRAKAERLKGIVKQQELVIQKLEAIHTASSSSSSFSLTNLGGSGGAVPAGSKNRDGPLLPSSSKIFEALPSEGSGGQPEALLRCAQAESRARSLEQQLVAVTHELARAQLRLAGHG